MMDITQDRAGGIRSAGGRPMIHTQLVDMAPCTVCKKWTKTVMLADLAGQDPHFCAVCGTLIPAQTICDVVYPPRADNYRED